MKTTHTHRGTCQACGSVQAVDNVSGLLAKHGYKVVYGSFQYVCNAAGYKPAEHDVTYTHETIASCLRAAESHEADAEAFRSGKAVPSMFKRWNPNKVKVNKRRHGGGTYETRGDYDVLPIAQATPEERRDRINGAIAEHEMNASGFRGHVAFLRRDVLTRLGQPLYPNEELTKAALTKGLKFKREGVEYELTRPAYSTFGQRLIGWYVLRVGAEAHRELRWTSKEIRAAMNPKPAKVEGAYATKAARKADLDKLNRQFDTARKVIADTCLAVPHDERTEAQNKVYWGPMQLNHWRPKHSEAALREFPALATTIAFIETLVSERERVKAAP